MLKIQLRVNLLQGDCPVWCGLRLSCRGTARNSLNHQLLVMDLCVCTGYIYNKKRRHYSNK